MPILGNTASAGKKPSTPTIGTATAGDASATVAYTASTYIGKGTITYTALSNPGSFTGTGASPITVSGLTNGTAYTFTVSGTTNYGVSSDASAASNSVTPAVAASFESIATLSGGGVSTVTFSSIPSTYKHLQIRMFGQAAGGAGGVVRMRFNGDTGSNYSAHYLLGTGTVVSAGGNASINNMYTYGYFANVNSYFSSIVDVIDYASTSKYKTTRLYGGYDSNGTNSQEVDFLSYLWMNTNAITSITIYGDGGNFSSTTQFALYGIKG